MDIENYIASGILELYVAGLLSEKENQEVYDAIQQYPEIKNEVESIEQAVRDLTAVITPQDKKVVFNDIKSKINITKVVDLNNTSKSTHWVRYAGWAASVALLVGSLWMFNENSKLKSALDVANTQNIELARKISDANQSIAKTNELNDILRAKNIERINLAGQTVSPDSYAKVYWNKDQQVAYIDVAGLPEPPPGKVYQVWSLKLDPLTPTSLGILTDFDTNENKVFTLANTNESQAFGITLEPAGGSDSPTLEQLYTLGTV